jgi:hypothetical protein
VKERLIIHNIFTDHVTIRSELRYLIRAKVVRFRCRVFCSKTGPITTVQVFMWLNPLQRSGPGLDPDSEPNREFGSIAKSREEALVKERRVTMRESTAFAWGSKNSVAPELTLIQPYSSYLDSVKCILDENSKAA